MVSNVLFAQTETQKIKNGHRISCILGVTKSAPEDTAGIKLARWGRFNPADTIRYWAEIKEKKFLLFKYQLSNYKTDTLTLTFKSKDSVRKDVKGGEKPNPVIPVLQEIIDLDIDRWTIVIPSHEESLASK